MNTNCNSGVYELVNGETYFYPTPYNAAAFIATAIHQQQQMLHYFLWSTLNPYAIPYEYNEYNSNVKTYDNKSTPTSKDAHNNNKDNNAPNDYDTKNLPPTTSNVIDEHKNDARKVEWIKPSRTIKNNHSQHQQTQSSSTTSNRYSILEDDSCSEIDDIFQSNSTISSASDTQQYESQIDTSCTSPLEDKNTVQISGQTGKN